MSVDQLVRHFQVPPVDTRTVDPKREIVSAPASGRVMLTDPNRTGIDDPSVAARRGSPITGESANQFNGNLQIGMETAGGASTLKVSVPADPDFGTIDAWAYSDWRLVLDGDLDVSFTTGGADVASGSARPNVLVARAFWVHVTFVLNGHQVTFPASTYWPDGEEVEVDPSLARFHATFLVEQLDVGAEPEVTFWSGGGYGRAA